MKPNRLIREKSPYLIQHAYNPVDWYPWGEEAFAQARKENKPILLSIGYSTCHWCHVMEKESFSNPEIADVMNQNLICIKLDREEHPEIDKIYMTAVMAMTGSGGWPLNVFLTPELKPFFGGTYFPPEERWGRIAWPELVKRIAQSWQDSEGRKKIFESAEKLTAQLKHFLTGQTVSQQPVESLLETAFESFKTDFDATFGGFGSAPKFPMPVNHNFLLRYYDAVKNKEPEKARKALEISLHTLEAMAKGGIYDQLGGGFHRYSTDQRWHLPHFEKMLYDNAQLAVNYLEAAQVTQNPFFERIARETLDYLLREMTHPEGGFYSAEDADSAVPQEVSHSNREGPIPMRKLEEEHRTVQSSSTPSELVGSSRIDSGVSEAKMEGAFYLWTKKEIVDALGNEDGKIFCTVYGVEEHGNVFSAPHGEFENKNVLYCAVSTSEVAKKFNKSEEEIEKSLERSRKKLFEIRKLRSRPHLDDKILTSWNGLAISAFARGAQILKEEKYLVAAENAARFIRKNLYDEQERKLYRRWREGEKKIDALADDYTFLIQGLLDLYESGFELCHLEWALELTEEQNAKFYDEQRGGFYMSSLEEESQLIARVKEDSDNVEPCASSVAALNLLRLAEFTNNQNFRKIAEKTLQLFTPQMESAPRSLPQMLAVLSFYLSQPYQIIVVGEKTAPETRLLFSEIHRRFIPNKVMLLLSDSASRKFFVKYLLFTEGMVPLEGKPVVYVCVNYACKLPTGDPKVLSQILEEHNSSDKKTR